MRRIAIELAQARDGDVRIDRLALDEGATLRDAIAAAVAAGLLAPGDAAALNAGVFGRSRPPEHRLADGDRVELTAGLRVDPKLARQRRVAKRRAAQPGNKWSPGR